VLQWLSVASPVLTANVRREVLGTSAGMPTMVQAAWLGLGAVLALAVGMHLTRGPGSRAAIAELRAAGGQLIPLRMLVVFAGLTAFTLFIVPRAAGLVPGLSQQIRSLSSLTMLAAGLVLWSATVNRASRPLAAVVVLLNVVVGSFEYFSNFKEILFLALVVISMNAVSIRRLLANPATILLTVSTLLFFGVWSHIKGEYRRFLNSGTGQQVVLVSPEQRVAYLEDRLAELRASDVLKGLETTVERIGYLTYFAGVLQTVPERISHQHGRLWLEAVEHVLLPRVLFPQKGAINDSDRTNEFSGFRVRTAAQGTSISIGYVGESYIDFGVVGMFVPILLLGMLWGAGYRLLMGTGEVPLLSIVAATVFVLSGALYFESSNIKIVGGALTLLLTLYAFLRFTSLAAWELLTGARGQPRSAPHMVPTARAGPGHLQAGAQGSAS
jgi:hypothetical protein